MKNDEILDSYCCYDGERLCRGQKAGLSITIA